ncbi:MerR family transcriptional regulator [Streptococcus agalactiae]|uniref:helix-turn-helix transcriptional regulator n=1 Tax=Streptococcus uberis TaxID=1349 RepID=UPI001FF5F8BB|nr:MerR family transcriptional regulator [Streptococcus uberis]MCC9880524.1 MerR family transcriptional regulator [Streptococcus agalactiae]MCK1167786.1 MerR family transcriptional regulator [Streptococcus uberis]MCK1224207.1 MerR family transcriptional regulator [Streptococcus uberis]MCK1251418.1 MerR family transcriptional regulator [Streptococcus uberis]MCK1255431.1 MerR family transcriptional regulator [Streptococcus uberis]
MDTLEQLKLNNIENLLQVLVNLLDQKSTSDHLEILTQKEVLKELDISPNTLKKWELKGLPRLEPPIEGTRSVYYKRSDIIKFLTI